MIAPCSTDHFHVSLPISTFAGIRILPVQLIPFSSSYNFASHKCSNGPRNHQFNNSIILPNCKFGPPSTQYFRTNAGVSNFSSLFSVRFSRQGQFLAVRDANTPETGVISVAAAFSCRTTNFVCRCWTISALHVCESALYDKNFRVVVNRKTLPVPVEGPVGAVEKVGVELVAGESKQMSRRKSMEEQEGQKRTGSIQSSSRATCRHAYV